MMGKCGAPAVTVRAADFALGDLGAKRGETRRVFDEDAERMRLCSLDVIEFQNHDIGLAAVDTRMAGKVGVEKKSVSVAIPLGVRANPCMQRFQPDASIICPTIHALAFSANGMANAAILEAEAKR